MTLAMRRLKNIGWAALVFLVAIMLYPLSLNVAALHSDLVRVDGRILDTKREISFLQAEIRTRASLHQLEEWNNLFYGYKPPSAAQFLEGEHALASLGGPSPKIKPVLVAAAAEDGSAPAGVIGSPFAPLASLDTGAGAKKIAANAAGKEAGSKSSGEAKGSVTSRTEKLAGMDEKLLSDDLMKDIDRTAKKERKAK